jgi:phage terminase large subunit-like protein
MTSVALAGTDPLAFLASLVCDDDGTRWGDIARPWQWEDAAAILDLHGPPNHFLTRARGGAKTTDLGGASLAVLITQAPRGSRCYALAADREQGRLLLDSIRGFATRTPSLQTGLEFTANRLAIPRDDVTLEVLAADAAGSWGLRPYFIVVDELAQWAETTRSRQLLESIRTATVKQSARLVIITTAGDPTHFAHTVREHARDDPLWRLHEVPGPVPWISSEALAEQERSLPNASFRRLHLNEWVESEDRLARLQDLESLITHDAPLPPVPGVEYEIAVDIGLVNDLTAVAVCHLEPVAGGEGTTTIRRVVVDRIETWRGSASEPVQLAAVQHWLLEAARIYRDVRIVFDPHQAAQMMQALRREGIKVDEFVFTQTSVGRLAMTLLSAVRNKALALPRDPDLIRELARVRLIETTPNVYRLDHDPREHNDRAIAIALAATTLMERSGSPGPRFRVLR